MLYEGCYHVRAVYKIFIKTSRTRPTTPDACGARLAETRNPNRVASRDASTKRKCVERNVLFQNCSPPRVAVLCDFSGPCAEYDWLDDHAGEQAITAHDARPARAGTCRPRHLLSCTCGRPSNGASLCCTAARRSSSRRRERCSGYLCVGHRWSKPCSVQRPRRTTTRITVCYGRTRSTGKLGPKPSSLTPRPRGPRLHGWHSLPKCPGTLPQSGGLRGAGFQGRAHSPCVCSELHVSAVPHLQPGG